jgi:hypothetical protein
MTPEQRKILKRAIERNPDLLEDIAKGRIKVKEHERDGKKVKEYYRQVYRDVRDNLSDRREAARVEQLDAINENRTTGWFKSDPLTREQYDRRRKTNTVVNAGIIASLVGSGAIITAFARYPHMARHFTRFVERTGKAPSSTTLSPTFDKTFRSGFVQRDTTRAIEKMWAGQFGEFKTSISAIRIRPEDGAITVAGNVTHGRLNSFAGEFQRTLSHTGEVHHDLLQLGKSFQGRGFAEAFNANALKQYKANGFDIVTMRANMTVGGYAWAKMGYEFRLPFSGSSAVARNVEVKNLLNSTRYSKADMNALNALMEAAEKGGKVTPQDFMAIGKANTWTTPYGNKMWIGKEALLGANYDAVKYLTEASRVRTAAQAAERAAAYGARHGARRSPGWEPRAPSASTQSSVDDILAQLDKAMDELERFGHYEFNVRHDAWKLIL